MFFLYPFLDILYTPLALRTHQYPLEHLPHNTFRYVLPNHQQLRPKPLQNHHNNVQFLYSPSVGPPYNKHQLLHVADHNIQLMTHLHSNTPIHNNCYRYPDNFYNMPALFYQLLRKQNIFHTIPLCQYIQPAH